ncbi:MAG: ABC transporter substrate-binding protein, partial [bacterium]|nr:ABC transporter substrate-binding protein [bacterium]
MMRLRFKTAALFLLLFTACHFRVPQDPFTLVWHLGAEPDTLNPIIASDAFASYLNSFIYETLIERDNKTLEWKPKLATHWTISPDHRTFTYFLRTDVKWQDGQPFTADDIVFSFRKIMDPAVDAPQLRVYYKDIIDAKKIDDATVQFTYRTPYFMALGFTGSLPIVPQHLFKEGDDFNKHPIGRAPVGTGPYRFEKWVTGKGIRVVRNENYWGKKPEIRAIDFEVVAENAVALQVLKKGELDFAGLRPIQWVRQTDSEKFLKRFQKFSYYTPNYSYIAWNNRHPIFGDKRVRQAMTRLINREAILEKLNFGLGKIVTGPFYLESDSYDPSVPVIPYDPAEAKALLAEAGWKDSDGDGVLDKGGKPFEFEFLIPSGSRFSERLGTILKEDMAKAGIRVTIHSLEWALFTKNLDDRKFDAVTLAWSLGFDQDPY